MLEIRWHGRGGQGAVTSVELFALAAIVLVSVVVGSLLLVYEEYVITFSRILQWVVLIAGFGLVFMAARGKRELRGPAIVVLDTSVILFMLNFEDGPLWIFLLLLVAFTFGTILIVPRQITSKLEETADRIVSLAAALHKERRTEMTATEFMAMRERIVADEEDRYERDCGPEGCESCWADPKEDQ